jgi:hypothetical protein
MKAFFFLLFLPCALAAQVYPKADYAWPMGTGNNPPEYGGDTQVFADFGSEGPLFRADTLAFPIYPTLASICDSAGQLLLYSNGFGLANKQHQLVENGDSLMLDTAAYAAFGLPELPAGALLLPNPANNGIYYLFHEELELFFNPQTNLAVRRLYLSSVDAGHNGGLGRVIERHRVLAYDSLKLDQGKILAVRHANGRDWWVAVPRFRSDQMLRFLVTPDGVLPQPDALLPALMHPGVGTQASFSPDGNRYANIGINYGPGVPVAQAYLYTLEFDRCTGEYSNMLEMPVEPWTYGVFFSPDSRLMYLAHDSGMKLTQFDMDAPDWRETGILVQEWDGTMAPFPTAFAYGFPAPDGKVYFVPGNETYVLHTIHRPNVRGPGCLVEQNVPLPAMNFVTYPNHPNFRLGPVDDGACDTLGLDNVPVAHWRHERDSLQPLLVQFSDLSYLEPATWLWDFGDGAMSQDTSPQHLFPAQGAYQVCLTVASPKGSDTACKVLEFTVATGEPQAAERAADITLTPNPARQGFQLAGADAAQVVALALLDLSGRVCHDVPDALRAQQRVALPQLPPGVYCCRLRLADGRVLLRKLAII